MTSYQASKISQITELSSNINIFVQASMPQIEIHSVVNFDTNTVMYDIGSTYPSLSELTANYPLRTYISKLSANACEQDFSLEFLPVYWRP